MPDSLIRPVAQCVIRRGNHILIEQGYDHIQEIPYYLLPGGEVAFGEYSWDALRRILREEHKLDIRNLQFLGAVENLYEANEASHHQIVFLFQGNYPPYPSPELLAHQNESRFRWIQADQLYKRKIPLYPEDVLDLIHLAPPAVVGL